MIFVIWLKIQNKHFQVEQTAHLNGEKKSKNSENETPFRASFEIFNQA